MSESIEMLKRHEGEVRSEDGRHVAYQCPDGKWTIGVGRNVDEDGGIGLSDEEVDFLLKNDLDRCEAELNAEYIWFRTLEGPRRDAILNIFFNLGATRFRGFKNAIAAMNTENYDAAAVEFMDSRWARQVGNRALELTDIIKAGTYV